jgi:nitrite reductase (NADH) large subunit
VVRNDFGIRGRNYENIYLGWDGRKQRGPIAMQMSSIQYVIIGNSAAGISAAREIRRLDPEGKVTIVSDEPTFGYSRVMLPLYIAGKISKRAMVLANTAFYASQKIRLLRRESVQSVDPKNQRIQTEAGLNLPYDRLLIAAGSSPKMLDIPGKGLQGIHPLRKLTDAEEIRGGLATLRSPVLVLGGGLVGVKSVEALLARKKEIVWVISSNRILSQILNQAASDLFLKTFQRNGVRVLLNTDVTALLGKRRLEGALLSDGTEIPCRLAIIGKGVNPNIGFLSGTGIGIGLNQGLLVDAHMATNLPSIYAAGDVAEPLDVSGKKNSFSALWPLAVEAGRMAGSNMAGVSVSFSGALRMNSMEVLGRRVVSVGDWEGEQTRVFQKGDAVYRRLVFSEGRLKGFILMGDIRCAGVLTSLVRNQTEVPMSILEESLNRGLSYQPRLHGLGGRIQAIRS